MELNRRRFFTTVGFVSLAASLNIARSGNGALPPTTFTIPDASGGEIVQVSLSHIVVLESESALDLSPEAYQELAGFGVSPSDVTEYLSGYFRVALPSSFLTGGVAAVQNIVDTLCTNIPGIKVSPLFYNSSSPEIIVKGNIRINFKRDISVIAMQSLVNSVNGQILADYTESMAKPGMPLWAEESVTSVPPVSLEPDSLESPPNGFVPATFRCQMNLNTGNAFEILYQANLLAGNSLVSYVEVFCPRSVQLYNDLSVLASRSSQESHFNNSKEWGLFDGQSNPSYDINVKEAWGRTKGFNLIRIAVVDDGVRSDNINMTTGWDTSIDPPLVEYYPLPNGVKRKGDHGTGVASIISSKSDTSGITGIAPECKVMPFRTGDSDGSGSIGTGRHSFRSSCLYALYYGCSIVQKSGSVLTDLTLSYTINGVSYVVGNITGRKNTYMFSVMITSRALGMSYIFSIRNANPGDAQNGMLSGYTSSPTSIAVGAIGKNGQRLTYSGYGNGLGFVMAGDGVQVAKPSGANDSHSLSGTSFASPHLSGIAALCYSMNPGITAGEIWAILRCSRTPVKRAGSSVVENNYHPEVGWGTVNAGAAVARASRYRPYDMVGVPGSLNEMFLLWGGYGAAGMGQQGGGVARIQRINKSTGAVTNVTTLAPQPRQNYRAFSIGCGSDGNPLVLWLGTTEHVTPGSNGFRLMITKHNSSAILERTSEGFLEDSWRIRKMVVDSSNCPYLLMNYGFGYAGIFVIPSNLSSIGSFYLMERMVSVDRDLGIPEPWYAADICVTGSASGRQIHVLWVNLFVAGAYKVKTYTVPASTSANLIEIGSVGEPRVVDGLPKHGELQSVPTINGVGPNSELECFAPTKLSVAPDGTKYVLLTAPAGHIRISRFAGTMSTRTSWQWLTTDLGDGPTPLSAVYPRTGQFVKTISVDAAGNPVLLWTRDIATSGRTVPPPGDGCALVGGIGSPTPEREHPFADSIGGANLWRTVWTPEQEFPRPSWI
jgi:subtilisin family serine protease